MRITIVIESVYDEAELITELQGILGSLKDGTFEDHELQDGSFQIGLKTNIESTDPAWEPSNNEEEDNAYATPVT